MLEVAVSGLLTTTSVARIPNIPFFYLAFRAYSHWRALQGGRHLEFLVKNKLLDPQPDPRLDGIYKSKIETVVKDINLDSEKIAKAAEAGVLDEAAEEHLKEELELIEQPKEIAEVLEIPQLVVELERACEQLDLVLQFDDWTSPEWWEQACVEIPGSDSHQNTVYEIQYDPENVNPRFPYLVAGVSIYQGSGCQGRSMFRPIENPSQFSGQYYPDDNLLEDEDREVVSEYTEPMTPNYYESKNGNMQDEELSNFDLWANSPDPYDLSQQVPSPERDGHRKEGVSIDWEAFLGIKSPAYEETVPYYSHEMGWEDPDKLINWGDVYPGSPPLGRFESDVGSAGSAPNGELLYGHPVDEVFINNAGEKDNPDNNGVYRYNIWAPPAENEPSDAPLTKFRWFLKSITIYPGKDCKFDDDDDPPYPVRINIENLHVDRDIATTWLQPKNKPYWGVAYNPQVQEGTITIEDPGHLLGWKMTVDEELDVGNRRGQDFINNLALDMQRDERNVQRGYMADVDIESDFASFESGDEWSGDLGPSKLDKQEVFGDAKYSPKDETTEDNIWPQHKFSGQMSIWFSSDPRYFHVDQSEEWRNREDIGEVKVPFQPITGGSLVDNVEYPEIDSMSIFPLEMPYFLREADEWDV
ncbi:hypothetical protein H072_4622 [Dactylellina haptotyla CBS 200.50]|uniref:Uncharacterized protein n=1 Tax=Dactylellina haptotyla (strain CBS 200.50) TaxID=1284197 RepID=S8BPS5_DACHA|nr:hypothetical protein H072_4622 [Dactylellina haptotyla CBS 200.50]